LVDYAECPLPTPLDRVLESGLAWCLFLSDRVHTTVPYLALVPPCLSFALLLALSFVLSIYILSLAAISSLALLHIIIVTTVPCGTYCYSHLSTYARYLYIRIHPLFQSQYKSIRKAIELRNRTPEITVYLIATDIHILNYHTPIQHTLDHTVHTNLLANLNIAHNSNHPRLGPHQPPP
jgi:hypothetical protein